ncbi:hypothetical protein CPB83DRAFT_855240 [Crepidotus variabilis]|uniref:DUF5745 domain-containing protein n=1 Tax=Crepidotus variabilis TaxID=179855 RepID=A0A9P6JPY1_9AGAR|nr:hypothetical protein CPB83DRAFT_855240 [Crepidotus variabilis]
MSYNLSPTKYARQRPPLEETELVSQLNQLLTSLHIPIPLISPTDLTPGLLVAILEALMDMRIPVIEPGNSTAPSKIQSVKIFLGILETDFLRMDVGLSHIDPRRLAEGEVGEMVFIAELLCWIGRRKKLIRKNGRKRGSKVFSHLLSPLEIINTPLSQSFVLNPAGHSVQSFGHVPAPTHRHGGFGDSSSTSPKTPPSRFEIAGTYNSSFDSPTSSKLDDLSILRSPQEPNIEGTTDISMDGTVLSSVSNILGVLPSFSQSLPTPPQTSPDPLLCIHQVPSPYPPSLLFSRSQLPSPTPPSTPPPQSLDGSACPEHVLSRSCSCDLTTSPVRSPPIRYSGFIGQVDEESEIADFELSQSLSSFSALSTPTPKPSSLSSRTAHTATAVREEYARTLELLNERAKLLSQLAELKNSEQYG